MKSLIILATFILCAGIASAQRTDFTYQGRLMDGSMPASGNHDFKFKLYDVATGGAEIGSSDVPGVVVSNGQFTVTLDFGAAAFRDSPRFLEISVRPTGGGGYILLSPRQPVTPAPQAVRSWSADTAQSAIFADTATNATNASNADQLNGQPPAFYQNASNLMFGLIPSARISGTYSNPLTLGNAGNVFNGSFSGSFAGSFAGNVGIGTSTPQARLHIAGVPDNDGIRFPDDTLQVSASPWRVRPDKTFYLSGLVGIGTQDPTALLHLKPTLDQTTIRIEADRYETAPTSAADSTATATQIAGTDANWANPGLAGTLNGASATATVTTPSGDDETNELDLRNFGFNIPANATITQVRIQVTGDNSGSCTGCSGPYARLEFLKTARLANGSTLSNTRVNRSTVVSTSLGNTNDLWGLALTPAIVNSANFGVRLRVRMIPVTTYYDPIHPNGAPTDCSGCTANAPVGVDGINVTIYYGTPTLAHAEYSVGVGPNGTDFLISPSPDFSVDTFAIDQNGRVVIRDVSVGGPVLNVYGGAAKTGGGSWGTLSDARLKRNILPLEGTLDRLLTLRGYSFEFTEDAVARRNGLPGRQMGLIAQEVEKVFPDWIDYTKDGYRMVTERATTALLVEALRDLRAEKDDEIKRLRAEIAKSKERLDRLEALIVRP